MKSIFAWDYPDRKNGGFFSNWPFHAGEGNFAAGFANMGLWLVIGFLVIRAIIKRV